MHKLHKRRTWEVWLLIVLESLFGLCALSVLLYRILGIAFDFGFLSYRVFNIVVSLGIITYIIFGLVKEKKNVYIIITLFSIFHFIEGIFISFLLKSVIHFLILLVMTRVYVKQWRLKRG